MKKIKKYFKNFSFDKVIKSIKKYDYKKNLKINILFVVTVISLLLNDVILRMVTVGNFLDIKPLLGSLSFILLILAPSYLFKPKNQIFYLLIFSILLTAICIVNSIYYNYYLSFASFSLLKTSLQVIDVADAVTKNAMELKDFFFVWQPIVILFLYLYLNHQNYFKIFKKDKSRKKGFITSVLISIIIFSFFFVSLDSLEKSRFIKQWNREFIVMKFGIYIYQLNDAFVNISPKFNSVFGYDEMSKKIKTYYESKEQTKTNKYTNIYKDKNIIMIHAESMQQFLIDLKINGVEITPNLNKLFHSGMGFTNFYSQSGVGTSSDTEFSLNTSLLPSTNGTVFISYWDREYIAIPNILKEQNYYTFSMHGNKGDMWNRETMHRTLGYDRFYSMKDYEIDEVIGLGLSDKSFFHQSVEKIKEIDQKYEKYYGTLIMLTNHTPFSEVDKYGELNLSLEVEITNEEGETEKIIRPYLEGTFLGDYLKAAHYADAALGDLIADLDREGLLEDTIIVLYGDHDAKIPRKEYNYMYNYVPQTDEFLTELDEGYVLFDYYAYELNRKVPFIIWEKNMKKPLQVDKVMGMIDVLPTLGNMVDFKSEYSLGNDIFNIEDNYVVFPNGNWLTKDVYFYNKKQEFKLLSETAIISTDYIENYTKKTENKLEISNGIIIYDFIKKSKESLEVLESNKR